MADLVVAGAGMAGLVAAAHARAQGADVLLIEKGDRAGGAMALSSGVVWRHLDWSAFRAECPGGDPTLQRLVYERLDGDLAWLESLGAPLLSRETGNPRTSGVRFDVAGLTHALAAAAGPARLRTALRELPDVPLVLATGGFAASRELLRRHVTPHADDLLLRTTPWSTGDGLALGVRAGGSLSPGMDEIYGRAMPAAPARVTPSRFVALAQLYARHAEVRNARGEPYVAQTWSETDVVQWMARQPGARAWLTVRGSALDQRVSGRTVAEMAAAAEAAGAPVRRVGDAVTVEVVAGISTTLGGLRANSDARVAKGVFAAGQDVGGIATGGYASGLAAALVLGRIAAESALAAAQRGQGPSDVAAVEG
jgi:succinate dehydrogenase/fumarate reductase flavoprotein subunit